MSDPRLTIFFMVDEDALLEWFYREGITVSETDLDGGLWGYYDHQTQTVCIQRGMPQGWRVATLLHESIHVADFHQGVQPQAVEDRIDEQVALLLVDPVDYCWAESQYGWTTGGIAYALELPRWVVSAYRRALART